MILADPIYGTFTVNEPVVAELLDSKAMRRLANVGMFATKFPCTRFTDGISRLEHSIGVFLLLRKLGAPIEEQVSGLVHDVSHSAFSHLVDYVAYADRNLAAKGEYGDNIKARYAKQSGIANILEKHGLYPDYILDDGNFPMKELPVPEICADRIDYALRDLLPGRNFEGWATPKEVSRLADSLTSHDGRLAFKTFASARRFAKIYSYMDKTLWGSYAAKKMYYTFSDVLKLAMAKGLLEFGDLYEHGDEEIIAKLRGAREPELDRLFAILDLPPDEFLKHPYASSEKYVAKVRRVDPLFMDGDCARRVSERDRHYAAALAALQQYMTIQPAFYQNHAKAY